VGVRILKGICAFFCRKPLEQVVEIELERSHLKKKRQINILEAELRHDRKAEFSRKALAQLRSARACYEITTNEVLLGRRAAEEGEAVRVDIDLSDEPFSHKVSRQQAVIQLTEHLEFHLLNLGKRAMYVNGESVPQNTKRVLYDMCLIEVSFFLLLLVIWFDSILVVARLPEWPTSLR